MSGFVTFQREATEHPLFKGDAQRFGAWFWLVSKACWKPTKFDIQGKIITLNRGQLSTSRSQLAKAWGMKESAVERFLTRLQTEQMIERATGQGRSIITICNYAKYQDENSKTGQATGQATGQRSDSHRTAKETIKPEPNGSIDIPPTPIRDADWPEIPKWMPISAWNGWLEMRRKEGKWPTARAIEITIGKLDGWKGKGHDPGPILDNSTLNNWTGVFEPKESQNGNHHRQAAGRTASGYRAKPDRRDDFTRYLDDQLGIAGPNDPQGAAGRSNLGSGSGGGELPSARTPALR